MPVDKGTRTDLLHTISEQKETLDKYEAKLRNVVAAYKGLVTENEALQNTIKALTANNESASRENESETCPVDDPLKVGQNEEASSNENIAALSNSLTTLMEEKSKMEAKYQAEKKALKLEHKATLGKVTKQLEEERSKIQHFESQVQEMKAKIRSEQHERERDQTDHALMLQELQRLVASERIMREQLELKLEETTESIADKSKDTAVSEHYEKMIDNLSSQLKAVSSRLRVSENKSSESEPLLLKMQQELAKVKASHQALVQQEQSRANKADETLRDIAHQSEERVCGLESKLSELSEVVGNYEKLRFQDQMEIQKLKDRVTQLILENKTLAHAAHAIPDNQIAEELMTSDHSSLDDALIHKKCHEELYQLKEEFERYKLRSQSVLKQKSSKETVASQEVEALQKENSDLSEKISDLRLQDKEKEEQHRKIVDDLQESVKKLTATYHGNAKTLDADYKQKLSKLEGQLHQHRDRTVALLEEKDREIDFLRLRGNLKGGSVPSDQEGAQLHVNIGSPGKSSVTGSPIETTTPSLFAHGSVTTGLQAEDSLLHFAQEKARKDVEITNLRKQKHDLETAFRDLQMSVNSQDKHDAEQVEYLKEVVRKLERNKSRESANLEYLKNVVFHYMICNNTHGKVQMLNAISTILQFSPSEKQKVLDYLKSWFGVHYSSHPSMS